MENPFQFGRIVKGQQFCNRKHELRELKVAVTSGNSIWLYSPHRTGKTSLIKNAISQIKEIKIIYVDFFKIRDEIELVEKLLNIYSNELLNSKNGIASLLTQLSNHLKNVSVSLDAKGTPIIGINPKTEERAETLKSILELPESINHSKQICIAFDEFQEIDRLDPMIKNIMNSVFLEQKKVNYIFLGSKESSMKAIFSEAKFSFFQYTDEMKISPISSIDLALFIHSMFKESKLKIDQKTISNILKISECHPHYTQYAAYVAWNLIYQKIPQDDKFLEILLSRIIESQTHLFRTIYDQLNTNQRKVLCAVSDAKMQNILSNATMLKFELPSKSTVTTALNSLLQKNLILRTNGFYKFENPIFKIWINKLYD
ncbi:ATP-binding protein [Candidatus Cloacimonadota bacterium]